MKLGIRWTLRSRQRMMSANVQPEEFGITSPQLTACRRRRCSQVREVAIVCSGWLGNRMYVRHYREKQAHAHKHAILCGQAPYVQYVRHSWNSCFPL